MEFLKHISLVSLFVILFNTVFATKSCDFPAIFNFGASNSDTGGSAAAFGQPKSPYGDTYFHRPAGRYCDGRIILDFIAQNFGHPFLSAYLDALGSNFSHGASFATLASTIRLPTSIKPGGKFSPFFLDLQYHQFKEFKSRTQFIRHQGGTFATLMPKEEYFSRALYTFDIGQNDLTSFSDNTPIEQFNDSIPEIVNNFLMNIKNIYHLGARSFWIHNTGPIGCLPSILTRYPSAKRDRYGCVRKYNEVAQNFNQKLKEAIAQLREDNPMAVITYVDIYTPKYSFFRNPKKYGFEHPLVTCCGYGGKYNYNDEVRCGGTVNVSGNTFLVGSCQRPSTRVIWDGVHYTEAANKIVFDLTSTGAFSDPPIPLDMSCIRNFTEVWVL